MKIDVKRVLVVGSGFVLAGVCTYGGFNVLANPSEGVKQTNVAAPAASGSVTPAIRKVASGEFNRVDAVHHASGQAVIYETETGPIVSLENFESAVGPDLHVYLSRNGGLDKVNSPLGAYVSLGKIKYVRGEQTYNLPDNYRDYQSVTIWCRAFQINFSSAELAYHEKS